MGKLPKVLSCMILFCLECFNNAKDIRNIFDSRTKGTINGFLWLPHIPRQDPLLISILRDVVLINRNLFSWKSYAIFSAAFPLYLSARFVDEGVHCCFYDGEHHRNVHQMPHWAIGLSKGLIYGPLAVLGSLTFFSRYDDRRLESRVFLEGIPFVWAVKDIIKSFKSPIHVRPKNEHFSKDQCTYGGFPSGHMAASTYITFFYGLQEGWRFALPLTCTTLFLGSMLVATNRHFCSQVIAGAALGAMYAFAASSVVDYNRERDLKFSITLNSQGGPAATVSWLF